MPALTVIETQQPDCIVLDLGLPDVGGLEVLRRLRARTTTPVVILTAVHDEGDKATALDLGADDYVTKPFTTTEPLARVRGALRHGRVPGPSIGREPSRSARSVSTLIPAWSPGGEPVALTRTEYRSSRSWPPAGAGSAPGRFLSERLWGPGPTTRPDRCGTMWASLRRKLDDPSVPER